MKKKSGSYVRDVIIGMLSEMVSEEGTKNEESGFAKNQGPVGSN